MSALNELERPSVDQIADAIVDSADIPALELRELVIRIGGATLGIDSKGYVDPSLVPEDWAYEMGIGITKEIAEKKLDTDPLTDLLNRVGFMKTLDSAVAEKRRFHDRREITDDFLVAFIDLREFGAINTQYGHSTGNDALSATAAQLLRSVRPGDSVARLGGDEFAILIKVPKVATENGSEQAETEEQIKTKLERAINFSYITENGVAVPVSGRAGVVTLGYGETADSVLNRADEAMRLSKQAEKVVLN